MLSLKRFINYCTLSIALVSLLVAFASPAAAKSVGGSLNLTPVGEATPGQCSDSYDDVCPSGSCVCQEYQGRLVAHFGGRGGRGTADLFLTIDNGLVTANPDGCRPVFGNAFLSTPLGNLTINVTGAFCDALGSSPQMKFMGGFGIASGGAIPVGFGTVSGAFTSRSNTLSVRFSGLTE